MPGEARGSKCKGTKVSNFLRGRLWGTQPGPPPLTVPQYISKCLYVCMFVYSHVSERAANTGYWTLMANTSLHHDTESKRTFDNKDQSSNHFNNKDKT